MIDYRRAFKIACELLNGAVLYGVDTDKIFEIMMDKDGVVSNDSYEEYILNHLQELDRGQYAIKALEQEYCEDVVNRQAVLDMQYIIDDSTTLSTRAVVNVDDIENLPPVIPQQKTCRCKNCRQWKDSDGAYRRGVGAESKCPINRKEVYDGNGYCYMFESKESEK